MGLVWILDGVWDCWVFPVRVFSRRVVHESLEFAPASFLRCGCLVPINSCGGLRFFIVELSDCWWVALLSLLSECSIVARVIFSGFVLLLASFASSCLLR